MSVQIKQSKVKRTFWTIAAFYALIAFEFFYMASPFALYFYSAYQPGLNFIYEISWLSWLTGFFLPHIVVETSSLLINFLHLAGILFFAIGIVLFIGGALQVYLNKLRNKGVVSGGLYKFTRHPQYVSFMVCSLGLLFLWPRFLVVIMFITLLFAYYFLAKAEEHECEQKFGQSYIDYKNGTFMFLPLRFNLISTFFNRLQTRLAKTLFYLSVYLILLSTSLSIAWGLQTHTINSLYSLQKENSFFLSVGKLDKNKFVKITDIALNDTLVQQRLKIKTHADFGFLNYVVPADFYISEIPMHINQTGQSAEHYLPVDFDNEQLYKIIFTKVNIPDGSYNDKNIFFKTSIIKEPVLEVWLDLDKNKVTDIKFPSKEVRYENIPMPIF